MVKRLNLGGNFNPKSVSTNAGAVKGINLLTAPEFQNSQTAQEIVGYNIEADGKIVKLKGTKEIFDVSASSSSELLMEFTSDIWIYAYANTVIAYTLSTDTQTVIKSDFVSSESYSGVKYGDYFYIASPKDKIGVISKTLDYDGQTGNFTVGLVVTGGTSGATAVILADSDSGAAGTLTLGQISGTFQDDEAITDSSTGAAVVDGILGFTYTELTNAPKAKVIFSFDARLFAGNIEGNGSKVQWSHIDSGTNPPFSAWSEGTNLSTEGGSQVYRNAGDLKAFATLGSQVVPLFDSGKNGFRIELLDISGTGLSQKTQVDFQRLDFGAERGAITTKKGIFYVNEAGIWQLLSGGSSQPFTDQEKNPSRILGEDFIEDLSFTDSDLVFDEKKNILYVTCKENATFNDLVLWYNVDNGSFGKIKDWQISRFMKISNTFYGASSIDGKVFQLFDGYEVNGGTTSTIYEQEIQLPIKSLNDVAFFEIKGFLNPQSVVKICFDAYDKRRAKKPNFLEYNFTTSGVSKVEGFNDGGFNSQSFNGGSTGNDLIETTGSENKIPLRDITRLIVRITSSDRFAHTINYFTIGLISKGNNRRSQNLTKL